MIYCLLKAQFLIINALKRNWKPRKNIGIYITDQKITLVEAEEEAAVGDVLAAVVVFVDIRMTIVREIDTVIAVLMIVEIPMGAIPIVKENVIVIAIIIRINETIKILLSIMQIDQNRNMSADATIVEVHIMCERTAPSLFVHFVKNVVTTNSSAVFSFRAKIFRRE